MSDYKRFISYIYEYVQGEKRESVGFVKVNARDGICKIQIHMKGFYVRGQQPYRAYVFTQRREQLAGQLLGELESRNGVLEWNGASATEHLMNGSLGLEESRGIYIEGEEHIYAAQWDDYPVDVERFMPLGRSARQGLAESDGRMDPQLEEKEAELLKAAELEQEAGNPAQKPKESEKIVELEEKAEERRDTREEQWKYLEKRFPVMQYVDGSGAVMSSIRLDPQSLTKVPRDKWELGNNSFLLHGIYQYRHLLLLRRKAENEITYYIGVPGVYNDQEQMMASMFGFQEFRMLKEPGARQGSFGYWCRTLGT